MNNNISLHGSYYINNFGDVLILAIQAKWIKEITGKEVLLPYASNIYHETINLSPILGNQGIEKSEKLVYGAGGYFGEPPTNKWKWGIKFLQRHITPARIAKKNNIKYAIIGPGVGPLSNIFTRRKAIRLFRESTAITVRDKESKDFLVQHGIPKENVNVTVDVALSLTKEDLPTTSIDKIKKLLDKDKQLKYGIHIGADLDSPVFGYKVKGLLEETIRFINENDKISPVIIIDNENSMQRKATQYLQKRINRKCIIYKHEYIWDTAALLSKLDLVLTTKLHVAIVSYALDTNCISTPQHPKTKRFYKQINQENLCLPIGDLNTNDVYNVLSHSLNEETVEELNKKRNLILPQLRKDALQNKKILKDFLLDS